MESRITNELIEQAKKAESVEALLALAKENGIGMTEEAAEKLFTEWHTTKELSDEELDSVAGGCGEDEVGDPCPKCGSTNTKQMGNPFEMPEYKCSDCDHKWAEGDIYREYE